MDEVLSICIVYWNVLLGETQGSSEQETLEYNPWIWHLLQLEDARDSGAEYRSTAMVSSLPPPTSSSSFSSSCCCYLLDKALILNAFFFSLHSYPYFLDE